MTAVSPATPVLKQDRRTAGTGQRAAPDRLLQVRPLRRDDGDLLDSVMAHMSTQSRYQRFHSPKPRLTATDRARLTNVDGHDHLALVALATDGDALGVARGVRLSDDPRAAEVAVAIVDACQHQGIGTELISRLARRAAAVGIERLVAHVLAESGLASTLARHGWRVLERDGLTVKLEVRAWRVAARSR
jgi:GNAT superfamily N-acetyltransferase